MPNKELPLPPGFEYREKMLYMEDVKLEDISLKVETPFFIYSANAIRENYHRFLQAFEQKNLNLRLCYALKACSNLAIINLLAKMGAGADVVSGGELYRALKAGVVPGQIVFAGVGKTISEIDYGLKSGILAFNVESEPELELIEERAARAGKVAPVTLRLNPDVEAHTHHYITTGKLRNKFGLPAESVRKLATNISSSKHLKLSGLQCHIGSQLLDIQPLGEAIKILAELALSIEQKENIQLSYLDIGGGLGVAYNLEEEITASPEDLAGVIAEVLSTFPRHWPLLAEPGRWLVANAGALVATALYIKESGKDGAEEGPRFAILDAAMNDLLRPALYQAYHEIVSLRANPNSPSREYEVVGPVCESGDFLAHGRHLPELTAGDKVAILGAGAYGFSMSSNYNSRVRAAEVLVDGDQWRVIRRRESYEDLIRGEEF